VIWPNYSRGKLGHLRMVELLKREFTGNDESKFHALYDEAINTDLLFSRASSAPRLRAESSTAW